MTMLRRSPIETTPVIVFQFSDRLELLHKQAPAYPGLTPAKLSKILHGGWQKLVPEEFHAVVQKLATLSESQGDITVEFPVYWMESTVWLRIIAAAVASQNGKRRVVGLVQDVTFQRQSAPDPEPAADEPVAKMTDPWRRLRHDVNSCLTSVLMNCDLLLETDCSPMPRDRIKVILSEALRIDQLLQNYREA
jgi:hypothetical protein